MARRAFRLLSALWFALAPVPANSAWADAASDALDALVAAYPDALLRHDADRIYWRDGTSMPVSDGIADKSFERLLKDASILDQFRLPYPRGALSQPPAVNDDPGRFRNEAFFLKLYGDCRKGEVQRHMVPIVWLPKTWGRRIEVSNVNDIAGHLTAVSAEIEALPEAVKRAAYPIAGVFNCRPVAGTGRTQHARLRRSDRSQHRVFGLLAVAEADRWPHSVPQPDAAADRRYLRAARLHLGRQVVQLRHDAL